ncbi:hypothetical protein HCH_04077 [Hahella chejuensis KCTC 2396]|uniref:Uncharacterized protein n=1 Tax=Hahella chejuensis (strain KCTC 2396) TaxID=349521 RepID=Q2SEY4_HAHCH|nr:hypothetical protein [Hahella chejuensis]ABC30790.1 hypothetical protein HCH_04077 [Hahella chejuensis KCTC 2396]
MNMASPEKLIALRLMGLASSDRNWILAQLAPEQRKKAQAAIEHLKLMKRARRKLEFDDVYAALSEQDESKESSDAEEAIGSAEVSTFLNLSLPLQALVYCAMNDVKRDRLNSFLDKKTKHSLQQKSVSPAHLSERVRRELLHQLSADAPLAPEVASRG